MNKEPSQIKPTCQICGCDKLCDLHRGVIRCDRWWPT